MDSSNCCIPLASPLVGLFCPLPSTTRGEPCVLDGCYNGGRPLLLYGNGRLVVVRELSNASTTAGISSLIQGFVYRGHTARVTVAKFSPSGNYVCSADARGTLRVWSFDSDEHLCKLHLPQLLVGAIRDVAWDGEGRRICVVGDSSPSSSTKNLSAKVIQWDTGVSCGELGQHVKRVLSCDMNSKRPIRCVTAGEDTNVLFHGGTPLSRILVDNNSTNNNKEHIAHTRPVNCVRFSPDGAWICSVGGDKMLRLYHGHKGHCVYEKQQCHEAAIYACSWSNDSKWILTCSADGTAKMWILRGENPDSIFLDCGHTWNVAEQEFRRVSLDVLVSPTSSASTLSSGVPRGGMLCGCSLLYPTNQPIVVAVNGNLTLLPSISSVGGETQPYALVTSSSPRSVVITGHQENIQAMAIKGNLCYTGDVDGVIVEWDLTSGNSTRVVPSSMEGGDEELFYKVHRGAITGLAVMPNGDVKSVGWDDAFRTSFREKQHNMSMMRCLSSNDKKLLSQPVALGRGTFLLVVVMATGLTLYDKSGHWEEIVDLSYEPLSVAVSREDTLVAIGDTLGNVHLYDVASRRWIWKIQGAHFKGVSALAFSNDASLLASADVRDICIWNAEENYAPVVNKNRWCFHTQKIQCLAWAPHCNVLASGGLDDAIYLWCVEKKMTRIGYPFAHRGGVVGIDFYKDGKWLVTAGKDGCVCQWNVEADVMKKFGVTL